MSLWLRLKGWGSERACLLSNMVGVALVWGSCEMLDGSLFSVVGVIDGLFANFVDRRDWFILRVVASYSLDRLWNSPLMFEMTLLPVETVPGTAVGDDE
jgi:hypothetical protein